MWVQQPGLLFIAVRPGSHNSKRYNYHYLSLASCPSLLCLLLSHSTDVNMSILSAGFLVFSGSTCDSIFYWIGQCLPSSTGRLNAGRKRSDSSAAILCLSPLLDLAISCSLSILIIQSKKTSSISPSHRSSLPPSAPREIPTGSLPQPRRMKISDPSHPIHHFHPIPSHPINVHCFSLSNAEIPKAERCEKAVLYGMAICNAWRSSVVFSEAWGRAGGRFPLLFGLRGWRVRNRTF